MSFARSAPFAALVIVLALAPAGHAASAATLGALELPPSKAGGWELKHAFGKEWQGACRKEVEADLEAAAMGGEEAAAMGGEAADDAGPLTLAISVDRVARRFDDRLEIAGKGTLEFEGLGRWTWSRGGTTLKEGSFDVDHSIAVDRPPWRSDLQAGWREILRQAVGSAVAGLAAE